MTIGFLSIIVVIFILIKISCKRSERRIFYIILLVVLFVLSVGWMLSAIYDGNEIRKASQSQWCKTRKCTFEGYVGLTVLDVGLFVVGMVYCVIFVLFIKKADNSRESPALFFCKKQKDTTHEHIYEEEQFPGFSMFVFVLIIFIILLLEDDVFEDDVF